MQKLFSFSPLSAQPSSLVFFFSRGPGSPAGPFPLSFPQPGPLYLPPLLLSLTRGTRPSSPSSGWAGTLPESERRPRPAAAFVARTPRAQVHPYINPPRAPLNPTPKPPPPASRNPSKRRRHCWELGALRDATAPPSSRRRQALLEFRAEVVKRAGLFPPLSRSASPALARRSSARPARRRKPAPLA